MNKAALRLRLTLQFLLVAALAFSAGCSSDPNLRKQKYFRSGQSYFQKGKYREAAIEFVNAIQFDHGYTDAHYQLAQSYIKTQQWAGAYQQLQQVIELQPENYVARFDLANLLIAAGNLPEAQKQVDLLLEKQPQEPQTHVTISSLLAARGDFHAAVEEMQKAIALGDNRWDSYLNLALLQVKTNQLDSSESSFKKAIALNPNAMDAQMLLGAFYQEHRRFSEAEEQFRKAVAIKPKSPAPQIALAQLYWLEGKKEEAEQYLSQSKSNFPDNAAGYCMLADYYEATGQFDKAIAEYGGLSREHPRDIQVKEKYVQLLIRENRIDEARQVDDEILKSNAHNSEALIERGQIQIEDGHLADAISTLQGVTKNDPSNALAHYYLGNALEKQQSLENAESEWREAVRLRPDLPEPQRALASSAMRRGDMPGLEQAANEITRLQPGSPDGYALRAISDINRKLFTEAERNVRDAIQVAPSSPVGYSELGNLRFVQKKYKEAETAYRDALVRDYSFTDALRGLMNTYLAQGQIDKAVDAASAQIAKSPINADFYDLLGTLLFRNKKDLGGAEEALRKSVELNKNNVDAVIKLGQVQAANGKVDQAIATYQRSLQLNPREVKFHILLGELYESREDWTDAAEAYRRALVIKPENPVASGNLAYVMMQSGQNSDLALSLAQTARRGLPYSPTVVDTLGWIYYQKGVYPLAINCFEEAQKLERESKSPDDPRVYYHLGMAYEKTGRTALARQELQMALKINPNSADAADAKKEIAQLKSSTE